MSMELHQLLTRQLSRLGLNTDALPSDLNQWLTLLEKISKAYTEADQERYMVERSMEISSRELLDLNERLETSQRLAGLGYWAYDREHERIILSKNLYELFGLKIGDPLPKFEQFMQMVHEEDGPSLRELIEKAFSEGVSYEYELRIQRPDGEYRWYYVIGNPISNGGSGYTLTGIAMDITKRKKAENELAALNEQLVSLSRQIGMADIASSTLHNVGNVLSSACVSAELLKEKIEKIHYKRVFSVIKILKEHQSNLLDYLNQDPKGKLIPEYLISLGEYIEEDNKECISEIEIIQHQLKHIKDIVGTQKDISHAGGMSEKVALAGVIDSALQLSENSLRFKDISIEKSYEKIPSVFIDKNKVLQILINLIKNAKEAIIDNTHATDKLIKISLQKNNDGTEIIIAIKDNGVGILNENLQKIFSFGFTTKEDGQGFGLHTSALAAQEMGGIISVESKGNGKGAIFTLSLPLVKQK